MRFAYLGSGSRGNAAIVECGATRVMLDCGFSLKQTERRLKRLDIEPDSVDALLVTHEHSDHISGVGAFARRYRVPVYMTAGTWASGRTGDLPHLERLRLGTSFDVGGLHVEPVAVPHDAREPCQFVFSDGRRRLGVLTDTGHVTPHIVERFGDCDALVVECNHDPRMLADGPYPEPLKARVGGRYGHLNNGQAASLVAQVEQGRLQHLLAVHISEKNNTTALAAQALSEALEVAGPAVETACQNAGTAWREIV